ncbi:MAG TPA: hypothetical protein VNO30_20040 [Kofleriaceae bacterium]|nr:hypothetical protein [Kofleriaceae bacterium]
MTDSRESWPSIPVPADGVEAGERDLPSWDRSASVPDDVDGSAARRRHPSPPRQRGTYERVGRFLGSKGSAAGTAGAELLAWLRAQSREVAEAATRELGDTVSKAVDKETRAAAIEILARVSPVLARKHVATGIAERPITEHHRYLLAFARIEGVADGSVCNAMVDLLEQLPGTLRHEHAAETVVEAFLSIQKLDSSALIENALVPLRTFIGFEQTRLLDTLAKAMRFSAVKPAPGLRDLIVDRWKLVAGSDGVHLADRATIGARVLEILSRSGHALEELLKEVSGDQLLECRILYQLAQQPLDFLSPEERGTLLRRTVKLLATTGQTRTLFRLLGTLDATEVPKEVTAVIASTL